MTTYDRGDVILVDIAFSGVAEVLGFPIPASGSRLGSEGKKVKIKDLIII